MTLIWTQKCNNKQSETVIFEGYFYAFNYDVDWFVDIAASVECVSIKKKADY